jgi:hypothetical protein
MRQKFIIPASLTILASIFLFLSCCEDCPPCPTEPQPLEPGSYCVYIADENQEAPGYIWVVDSKTHSLIDSIETPAPDISVIEASPDGDYLATFSPSHPSVLIYDTDDKDTVASITPKGYPLFTRDNSYLLISHITTHVLYKYEVVNWSLISSDTLPAIPGGLFYSSRHLYGRDVAGIEYFIYDYESMSLIKADSIRRSDGSMPRALEITNSSDDRYFYFISRPDKLFKYDIANDSIVDSIHTVYGGYHGDLKCTPDGRFLVISESTDWPDRAIGNLLIVEQENFAMYRRIPTWGLNPYMPGACLLPGQLAITHDGSKVFCAKNVWYKLPPVSFNLLDLSASNIKGLPDTCSSRSLTIGKQIH